MARPEGEMTSAEVQAEVKRRLAVIYPLVSGVIIGRVVWETLQVLSEWEFVELETERAVQDGNRH